MTVVAKAMADKKTVGHLLYRGATQRQYFMASEHDLDTATAPVAAFVVYDGPEPRPPS